MPDAQTPQTPAAAIDWERPWLAPYRTLQDLDGHGSTADILNRPGGAPVRFVDQSALPPGQAYERFIFDTGTVPTRNNLHDYFNGLSWLRFPQTKTRLNQLQAAEIALDGVQPLRGPVRDALTLFDENAAFLSAPSQLWTALQEKNWQQLFIGLRPLWAEAKLVLFGHALLEKLVSPRKPITAHIYLARPAMNSIAELDAAIAADLNVEKLSGKPFAPLPVLGVPDWWPENENFSFYDDSFVFRPRR